MLWLEYCQVIFWRKRKYKLWKRMWHFLRKEYSFLYLKVTQFSLAIEEGMGHLQQEVETAKQNQQWQGLFSRGQNKCFGKGNKLSIWLLKIQHPGSTRASLCGNMQEELGKGQKEDGCKKDIVFQGQVMINFLTNNGTENSYWKLFKNTVFIFLISPSWLMIPLISI